MRPFLGQHQNRLDAKGRVSVPSAFRSVLDAIQGSSEMILRPSTTFACIEAWPVTYFNDLAESLEKMDVLSQDYDDRATDLYSQATLVQADGDGRILLPEKLVKHAKLENAVVFMGRGSIFQIWEPAAAEQRTLEARENSRARAQGKTLAAAGA
jgi:MraZ protein